MYLHLSYVLFYFIMLFQITIDKRVYQVLGKSVKNLLEVQTVFSSSEQSEEKLMLCSENWEFIFKRLSYQANY